MDSNLKRLSMQVNVDDLLPASEKEKEYMVKMRPSTTAFQDGVRRLRKNKVAMVSFWIILLITVASIFVPFFWPYKYESMLGVRPGRPVDASYNNLKPFEYAKSEKTRMEAGEKVFPHVFGTDSSGRESTARESRWRSDFSPVSSSLSSDWSSDRSPDMQEGWSISLS